MVEYNTARIHHLTVDEASNRKLLDEEILVDGGLGGLIDIAQGPDGYVYFNSSTAILRLVPQ